MDLDRIEKFKRFIGPNPLLDLMLLQKKSAKAQNQSHCKQRKNSESEGDDVSSFTYKKTPPFIVGELRPYQIEGVNWLIYMHTLNINCVLADEMGLGKTLQTITFLGYLKEHLKIRLPHLLIVPKSTLDNWANEFKKFYPTYKVFKFHCPRVDLKQTKDKMYKLVKKNNKNQSFVDVILTTYEMCISSKILNRIKYSYVLIDEAHRIKNENSKLSQFVRIYWCKHRMLITGTPLQNNVRELWALLNFLVPEVFCDSELFEEWIQNTKSIEDKNSESSKKSLNDKNTENKDSINEELKRSSVESLENKRKKIEEDKIKNQKITKFLEAKEKNYKESIILKSDDSNVKISKKFKKNIAESNKKSKRKNMVDEKNVFSDSNETSDKVDIKSKRKNVVSDSNETSDKVDIKSKRKNVFSDSNETSDKVDIELKEKCFSDSNESANKKKNVFSESNESSDKVNLKSKRKNVFSDSNESANKKSKEKNVFSESNESSNESANNEENESELRNKNSKRKNTSDISEGSAEEEKTDLSRSSDSGVSEATDIKENDENNADLIDSSTSNENTDEINEKESTNSEKNDEEIGKNRDDSDLPKQDERISMLRSIVMPFFLRREKRDVELSLKPKKIINLYPVLTEMQRKWYRSILKKEMNYELAKSQTRLMNIVMHLRKVCNHPYLFDGAEPEPFTTDEHLVYNSGKMILLDKLLKYLKERKSRVLIFSQMSRMLDILEDYCDFRGFSFRRLDGSTITEDRSKGIDEFNSDESIFIYLLTTRAGGLGINLTGADCVIIYDCDWNPQMDLQAMDRAHRIGQKKEVHVFKFIADNTIEEKILERCMHKLKLDERLMKNTEVIKKDLLNIIASDVDSIMSDNKDKTSHKSPSLQTLNIEDILAQGEKRTKELNEKIDAMKIGKHESIQLYNMETADFNERVKKLEAFIDENENQKKMKKRVFYDFQFFDPKLNYLIENNASYEEVRNLMKQGFDWSKKEFHAYLKACEVVGTDEDKIVDYLYKNHQLNNDPVENESKINQNDDSKLIDNLNIDSTADSKKSTGGIEDVDQLISLLEDTVRNKTPIKSSDIHTNSTQNDDIKLTSNVDSKPNPKENNSKIDKTHEYKIEQDIDTKKQINNTDDDSKQYQTFLNMDFEQKRKQKHWIESEVRRYHKTFWERKDEVLDIERFLTAIEKNNSKRQRLQVIKETLQKYFGEKLSNDEINFLSKNEHEFMSRYRNLKVHFNSNSRSKQYTELADKILMFLYYNYIEDENVFTIIRKKIFAAQWSQYDYFLKSRNTQDLMKRVNILTGALVRYENSKKQAQDSKNNNDNYVQSDKI
ncbi:hypothetical protein EDEG_05102 [Edhazardia aedis USNM 41457]|uniref:Uncharacterized protein n=1 Tax=Edhazardia aedis (strain USNM 41457) TaxID=1003232 RepID=A0A0L1P639_EDHAE|nr:hypothetical protein EDEG_05102 [Edhazardia aedis USNM 41457]|eukprot:KNH48515.1 hypothetical protein EDEG_05102 [Edhazardia aedis USNM 41457]